MLGTYVLENKKGQVVRTLHWESSKATVVYLTDTRRISAFSELSSLDENEIDYTVLAQITKDQVKKSPVAIGDVGFVKYLPEVETLSPTISIPEESSENYKAALKYTVSAGVVFLLLVFIVGHFAANKELQAEQQVVMIKAPEREKLEIIKPQKQKPIKRQTVAQKPLRKMVVSKIAQIKKVHRPAPHHQSVNNMGDLAILGSLNHSRNQGGLKLNAVTTSAGPGLGGSEGSGGMQTSMYGKGLVSAPLGPNARANGAGGYGNHGAGGGSAGYGKMSLVGSATAYFEPVQSDAVVEGGLDRAQIAEVIQRHLGQIRMCYEQGLQVSPGLSGRVAVKFLIGGTGYVNLANVSNTSLHSGTIENCIVSHLKGWKFPEPRGGVIVKVNYPFVLKRVSQS
jgi:hypothetical protein